ncbi:unnamed protein product [Kuraishia capsulata CBS 1993]|uniref:DUF726 domain protein n=1 Tax=Kuraishia capsulata CBS 1993 TaxID=1382522 RepID=W6MMM0_9ASCO|nr:uncharacterized protein KUCA_T00003431001 [Kuraishia capsulata CBS 1993]CDK27453.1 unnamed protein product [Kuraishia capsulata CBS 1993]
MTDQSAPRASTNSVSSGADHTHTLAADDGTVYVLPSPLERAFTYTTHNNSTLSVDGGDPSILRSGGQVYSEDSGSRPRLSLASLDGPLEEATNISAQDPFSEENTSTPQQISIDEGDGFVEFHMGGDSSVVTRDPRELERLEKRLPQLVRLGKGSGSSLDLSRAPQNVGEEDSGDLKQSRIESIEEGPHDSDSDSDSDSNWQQMDTKISYDIYNSKGQKLEDLVNPSGESLGNEDGATKGYTRVAAQEQATKYSNIDKEFAFLFKNEGSNLKTLHDENEQYQKEIEEDVKGKESDNDTENDTETHSDSEEDDTFVKESMSAATQLHSTKKILKDSQKIAYVGLVRLVIVDMATDLAMIRSTNSISTMKKLSAVQGSFENWSMKIMGRLYTHMDLSTEELKMIETLSAHGVEPRDLVPSLITSETVLNPLHEKENTDKVEAGSEDAADAAGTVDLNDPGIIRPEQIASKKTLDIDVRWTVVCDLFLNLLADSVYDSRSRTLLLRFGKHLNISSLEISQFERRITDAMEIEENAEQTWNEREILNIHRKRSKKRKYVAIGLATLGGGLVIGLSAGLLAPVIGAGLAAGLSTVGIAGTSGFLAGVGGTTIVTTGAVIAGGKIGMSGMSKRVGSVKTFEFRPLHNNGRVNLIVTVSGWMSGTLDDVRLPFSTVDPVMGDLYSVLWEPELLTSMGQTINILATEVLTQSVQQILGSTIMVALMSAVQIPLLLTKLGYLLDNPWNVSLDRAWSAGLVLADTLINRNLGVRPITLVGFSLGARLIYSCLLELAKQGAQGLVENVIIFGAPVVHKTDQLALARSVVSGKFINGYSKRDWILGYLFRATSGGLGTVAGLSPVEGIAGIENFDCTEYVEGHMEYRKVMPKLLAQLDWEVLDEEFVEIDEPDLEQSERQRKLISDFEVAREKMQNQSKKPKGWVSWLRPRKKEWWELYEEGKQQIEHGEGSSNNEDATQVSDPESDVMFDLGAIKDEVAIIEKASETKSFKLQPNTVLLPPMDTSKKLAEEEEEEDEIKLDKDMAKNRKSHAIFQLSPKRVNTEGSLDNDPALRSFKTRDHGHESMRSPSLNLNVMETREGTRECVGKDEEVDEPNEVEEAAPVAEPQFEYPDDDEFGAGENIQMTFQ